MPDPTTSDDLVDDKAGPTSEPPPADTEPGWATLLTYLVTARGFDFHGYKPTTLARRIRKRMAALDIHSFSAYQDHLEVHPDEFTRLFNTILINVTGFFRDPQAWDMVRTQVLPRIVAVKAPGEPTRAWSAGCASGEEAYTIAMVLAEELGADQFRERVKIYATDVDEDALNAARHAAYTTRQIETVPPELLDRYFDHLDGVYVFRKDFRRQVIFGRHDLLADSPISRVDLLVCRNTLMYFNSEAQARILSRFHFALNEGGFLFLGRAETLMTQGQIFLPLDVKRRISQKAPRDGVDRLSTPARESDNEDGEGRHPLPDVGLDASPVPQLLVDPEGIVAAINEQARTLFGLRLADVGRPLRDLQISYRPADLRSLIDQSTAERRPVVVKEMEWRAPSGDSRWLDVQVASLVDASVGDLGTLIAYTDVTGYRRLTRELEQSHQALETAYEELQSTNEELETTNKELQSTVEELETTNEELQSTNEELETMNEELQSTNEELQTHQRRAAAPGGGAQRRQRVPAVGHDQSPGRGRRGGPRAPVAGLEPPCRGALGTSAGGSVGAAPPQPRYRTAGRAAAPRAQGMPVGRLGDRTALDAVNRRGKTIRCTITCTPLMGGQHEVRGSFSSWREAPPRLVRHAPPHVHPPAIRASPEPRTGTLSLLPAGHRREPVTHSLEQPIRWAASTQADQRT
jgi:two-component system, chemotaxis family, CheB/CheR fusion protein